MQVTIRISNYRSCLHNICTFCIIFFQALLYLKHGLLLYFFRYNVAEENEEHVNEFGPPNPVDPKLNVGL